MGEWLLVGTEVGPAGGPELMGGTAHPVSKVAQAVSRLRQPGSWEYGGSARHGWVSRVQTGPDFVPEDIYRDSRHGFLELSGEGAGAGLKTYGALVICNESLNQLLDYWNIPGSTLFFSLHL